MALKFKIKRPKRSQLHGVSPSELKTLLKRRGYRIGRDFFRYGCQARFGNRSYRFRWYSTDGFYVDKSCIRSEFDRWANSVDEVIPFGDWLKGQE